MSVVYLSRGQFREKVLNIGAWNMDAAASVSVAHGLDLIDIRKVDVLIRTDNNSTSSTNFSFRPLIRGSSSVSGDWFVTSDNVVLQRETGGAWDSTNFASTTVTRGYITILYEGGQAST